MTELPTAPASNGQQSSPREAPRREAAPEDSVFDRIIPDDLRQTFEDTGRRVSEVIDHSVKLGGLKLERAKTAFRRKVALVLFALLAAFTALLIVLLGVIATFAGLSGLVGHVLGIPLWAGALIVGPGSLALMGVALVLLRRKRIEATLRRLRARYAPEENATAGERA